MRAWTVTLATVAAAIGIALAMPAASAGAQVLMLPTPTTPPTRAEVFQRAQRLVNDGNGAEGRALVDSLLNATEPRSPEEAEVLFWRATLAESWDQAQRDYLRVMLEHERSSFAAPAMLRLAQGEVMRADTAAALRYLDRLLAEWPGNETATVLRDHLRPPVAVPVVPAAPATDTTATRPAPAAATTPQAPRGAMAWSVQVAAFPGAEEAAAFAAELRTRGYEVRVDGTAAPYRVRFGYYATRADAAAAMQAYKDRERGDAFLAQVPRP